ncbi:hypothetical protein C7S18_01420 [Ahniella affigens]|uniref:Uncharacterized protein n=1 Tax=Ahniella affigens TaxID=2021234 RepID=A0A2P1PM69_9GAMM|nr:hypothetical protein [Ahniella affigens]AVP95938.1 hypothetical protein C7S18_01420 [Ahniella affigens]
MSPLKSACLMFGLLLASRAEADWLNLNVLRPSDLPAATSNTNFGQSVAADYGDDGRIRALYVGSPNETAVFNNVSYPGNGAVYVLIPNGNAWVVHTRLVLAGYLQANAHFGAAIAVHRGSIIIGAPDFDNEGHPNSGRVHFLQDYRWNSASPTPLLIGLSSRGTTLDNSRLGASVAVAGGGLNTVSGNAPNSDGSWFAAGAPGMVGAGCVLVDHFGANYNFDLGDRADIGSVCSGNAGDALGASVAVQAPGNNQVILLTGAPGTMQNGQAAAGAAHVYIRVNGVLTLIDTLLPPNPQLLDSFGTSVGLQPPLAYVGGTGRILQGVGRTGSVSVFEPAAILGYDFATEVFPTAPRAAGDLCGASLYPDLLDTERFAMGCPGADGSVANQGVLRVLQKLTFMGIPIWVNQRLAVEDSPHGADDLGRSVVLVNGRAYAGAPLADDSVGANNGAVYEFADSSTLPEVFADSFE